MIDVRVTEIGGDAIRDALERAPEVIQSRLLLALNGMGREAQSRARAAAPYDSKRKTGVHLREAVRYFAWANPQKAELVVRAIGGKRGAPHAHLIERGVARQDVRVYKRTEGPANRVRSQKTGRFRMVKSRSKLMYVRHGFQIKAQPFFDPAIRSLGDVGADLQNAVAQAAADVQGGA